MQVGFKAKGNFQRVLRGAMVLAMCLLGCVGAFAVTGHGHGVVVHLNANAVSAFNARHGTQTTLLNANRGLYLVQSNDSRTDVQLLNEINSDANASGAELNQPVQMTLSDDQSTVSVLNAYGVDCNPDPSDPFGTPNDPTCALSDPYNQSTVSVLNDDQSTVSVLNGGATVDYYGTQAPTAYLHQVAVGQIAATNAHSIATGLGVVVALIDDGVDPSNPVLAKVLLRKEGINTFDGTRDWSAYADLTDDQSTVSVLNDDQSTVSVLNDDQSTVSVLNAYGVDCNPDPSDPFGTPNDPTCALSDPYNQSTVSVLNDDQSTVSVLNDDQSTVSVLNAINKILKDYPEFGHGTEVAGLIHLIAPQAKILPIKAFGPSGTADIASVVEAVSYSIDKGANVINMSFSATAGSPTLKCLVAEAQNDGMIVVAAAGNSSASTTVFPGSYAGVLEVAAVDASGNLASFSNYGLNVDVAAPGVNLLTTFPGNGKLWAVASGTSFSAPLVTGEGALLYQILKNGGSDDSLIENTSSYATLASTVAGKVGYGLIQVQPALNGASSHH